MLRLVLALSVVMSHGLTTLLGIRLFDGAGAVWIFFAISGFLITIALSNKYQGSVRHLGHFYWNRVIRLYPAYWLWLAITITAYLLIPAELLTYQRFVVDNSLQASGFWADHLHTASISTRIVAGVANIFGFFSDALLYLGLDKTTGALVANPQQNQSAWGMGFMFIGQFWSIGIELFFYAIAPLITKSLLRVSVLFCLSASGYLEQAWTEIGLWAALPPAITYLQAPKFLWMFMVGSMLGHVFLCSKEAKPQEKLILPITLLLLMYAYIASRCSILFPIQRFPWWIFAGVTAAVPLLFAKTAANKFDRFAGDLSYPVYVNHFIIVQTLGSITAPNGLAFALTSILFGVATLIFVERPARSFKLS
jgi:peptidoglycan/LPS O-acetylase OafA/YrhL